MKFKITIPAQSLRIEIPEQEIEMDFQPIWEIDPPVIEPPVNPEPPIVVEPDRPKDYIYLDDFQGMDLQRFYQALMIDGKILRFQDKTSYDFGGFKQVADPTILAIVGKDSIVWVNKEDAQELFLFTKDNPRFGSIGVNWLIKGDIEEKITQPTKALFRTVRDKVKTGMLAMIGSHVPNENTLGINLARFIYSGSDSDSNFLYVIGKDITSNGPDFMQLKAPNGGNLYSVLENVKVNNPIVQAPATHKYNPTTILSKGIYDGENYKITSDNTVSQVLTWSGYQNTNVRTILNIGRFVWNVSENDVIDDKIIHLNTPNIYESLEFLEISETKFESNVELQPGDITSFGVIKSKQIAKNYNWLYELEEKSNYLDELALYESSIDLPINQTLEASLTYKGNALIEIPLNVNSKFNDWYITLSSGYGWTCYNQKEITAYWKNVELTGFYRQSESEVGYSKGYCLENVNGIEGKEFDPKPLVQTEMPKEAKEFIDWLESLE